MLCYVSLAVQQKSGVLSMASQLVFKLRPLCYWLKDLNQLVSQLTPG